MRQHAFPGKKHKGQPQGTVIVGTAQDRKYLPGSRGTNLVWKFFPGSGVFMVEDGPQPESFRLEYLYVIITLKGNVLLIFCDQIITIL